MIIVSCNYSTTAKEIVVESFSNEQIKQIELALINRLDTLSFYNVSDSKTLLNSNWSFLDPIFIFSDFSRAIVLIPKWYKSKNKIHNFLVWICGYRYMENWYFFRPTETQYLDINESPTEDYDPLKWKPVSNAIQDYTKGYLKYNYLKFKWVINDNWFRGFMDNRDYLRSDHYHYSDQKILQLPDRYWVERYIRFHVMGLRHISKVKELRKEEDAN